MFENAGQGGGFVSRRDVGQQGDFSAWKSFPNKVEDGQRKQGIAQAAEPID